MCYYSYDDMQQPHKLKLLRSLFQMKAGIACLISQRSKQWKWDPSPVLSSEPELITVSLGCLSLWHCSYLLHLIFIICCIQCPNWFIVLDPYKPASLFILFVERIVFVYQGRERGKQRENIETLWADIISWVATLWEEADSSFLWSSHNMPCICWLAHLFTHLE